MPCLHLLFYVHELNFLKQRPTFLQQKVGGFFMTTKNCCTHAILTNVPLRLLMSEPLQSFRDNVKELVAHSWCRCFSKGHVSL